ncbi:MAG TPA: PASTA domain-containing protein [Gaiellaceae bacterium]
MRPTLAVVVLAVLGGAAVWLVTRSSGDPVVHAIVLTGKPTTTVVRTTQSTIVPNVVGKAYLDASAAVNAAGLHARAVPYRAKRRVKAGTVVEQAPPAGRQSRRGAEVVLVVASRSG